MGLRRSLKKFLRRLCGKNKAAAPAPARPRALVPVFKPANTSVFADTPSATSTMCGFAFGRPKGPILSSPAPSLLGIRLRPARRPVCAAVRLPTASHHSAFVSFGEKWYGGIPPVGLGGDCPGCQHELAGFRPNHAEFPHICGVVGLRCSGCGSSMSEEESWEHKCK